MINYVHVVLIDNFLKSFLGVTFVHYYFTARDTCIYFINASYYNLIYVIKVIIRIWYIFIKILLTFINEVVYVLQGDTKKSQPPSGVLDGRIDMSDFYWVYFC